MIQKQFWLFWYWVKEPPFVETMVPLMRIFDELGVHRLPEATVVITVGGKGVNAAQLPVYQGKLDDAVSVPWLKEEHTQPC